LLVDCRSGSLSLVRSGPFSGQGSNPAGLNPASTIRGVAAEIDWTDPNIADRHTKLGRERRRDIPHHGGQRPFGGGQNIRATHRRLRLI
jgi:hypothetical protein